MKAIVRLTLLIACICFTTETMQAQFFKKLGKKVTNAVERTVERKAERKAEKTTDKTIDTIFSKKEKEASSQDASSNFETKGSAILKHNSTYGNVQIDNVGTTKVEKGDNFYKIYSSWWSHEADIYDGFVLKIKSQDILKEGEKGFDKNKRHVFKIPEEATLKIAYDPLLPYEKEHQDGSKRAVTDEYQNYNITTGEVTVDVMNNDQIQISFSGDAMFTKITRTGTGTEDYTRSQYPNSISGGIEVYSPQYNIVKTASDDNKIRNKKWEEVSKGDASNNSAGVYVFTLKSVNKVTDLRENKSYTMSYLMNSNTSYVGIKADMGEYNDNGMQGESIIVMDGDEAHIFVETAGMKFKMSPKARQKQKANPTEQLGNYDANKFKKTGRTKTILGATCYEYTYTDGTDHMEMWIAPSVNVPNWFMQNKSYLEGHIMEYTITSKDGSMKSEVISIEDNIRKEIRAKDYKKMF
ncbi:DUF4412 domain-containing protein [Patiriisocius hiemis]|uniref:DUF4412 domain-containing protein n=1 Tax=Patiriisocius hiemis TaxID=3075604 RepID=A0ABU2YB30_9FLAO|nr:DUF4412 domain-containing protein [Constantimarinum sp. W242]MDT0555393.1 DUF4412 domain-containing protein [Constantimarinum sp. W242]